MKWPPGTAQVLQDALGQALGRDGQHTTAAPGRPADSWDASGGAELALLGAPLAPGGEAAVAGAALGARGPGPGTPSALVRAARELATSPATQAALGLDGAYQPRTPGIAGDWTGRWKCNLLVADALWAAGFRVPTHDIGAPGAPRVHVEAPRFFYRHTDCFTTIDRQALRPGDVITLEYPAAPGEPPASHCMIVSGVERDASGRVTGLTTIEATFAGGRESTAWSAAILGARGRGGHVVTTDGELVRFLRPRR